MKVMVIGSGGREHAVIRSLRKSPEIDEIFALPSIGWLPRQPVEVLVILTCVLATIAAVQEGYYIRAGKEIG